MDTNKVVLGSIFLAASGAVCLSYKAGQELKNVKDYVIKHNPDKALQLKKKYPYRIKLWQDAAKEVQDSLRQDSIARTNYAKGIQMVRDSIAKDTVKLLK